MCIYMCVYICMYVYIYIYIYRGAFVGVGMVILVMGYGGIGLTSQAPLKYSNLHDRVFIREIPPFK